MEDRLLCISKICRTCLSESSNLKSLHSEMEEDKCTLLDALRCLTNNAVLMAKELPDRICGDCEQIICQAEAFKRRCKQSETYLEDYLKNDLHHSYGKQTNKLEVKQEKTDPDVTYVPFLCSYCRNKYATLTDLAYHTRFCQNRKRKSVKKLKHLKRPIKVINTSRASLEEKPLDIDIKTEDLQDIDCDDDSNFNNISDVLSIEYKPVNKENPQATDCGLIKTESLECHTESCSKEIKLIHNEVHSASEKVNDLVLNSKTNKLNSIDKCEYIRKRLKKTISDSEKYQCSLCMRKFIKKSSLAMHIKKHEDGDVKKEHICNTCKREFKHKAHLDNHILNVHTREKGFTCDTCSKCFSTQGSLDTHKELHKVTKRHQCTMCDKSFVMLSTLTDHMRTHTGERPFLCSTCGRGFSQKTNLAQHMRRHLGQKPFKCETCGRGFVSKGELEAHMRTHSGAHPFLCDDCGSGFTTSSSLVKHRRTHTGERPYACDLCSMRFAVSGTLKNHRRTHTNERPYQCSHCDKAFVQKNDLVSHTRCHTGERPYICTVCGQAFRKTSGLKTHLRNCHKDGRDGVGMVNGGSGMLGIQ